MIKKIIRNILLILTSVKSKLAFLYLKIRFPHVNYGKNMVLDGLPVFRFCRSAIVDLKSNITFTNSSKYNMIGINKKCSVFVGNNAKLMISENCGFSGVSIYCASSITIGKNVNVGGNVFIWDTDFHPLDYQARREHRTSEIISKSVVIEDDVFIGGNSTVLKGVKIGEKSIVGAGSVVTKCIPAGQIWAGNPAKFIRYI